LAEDLYNTLGVEPDASPEEIRRAYRKKAKQEHPDAGGSAEKFGALVKAHRVLSDAEKRARYDRTGEADDGPDNTDQKALSAIDQILDQVLGKDEPAQIDIVEVIRAEIDRNIQHQKREMGFAKKHLKKLEKVKGRFRTVAKRDIFALLLDRKIDHVNATITNMRGQLALFERAAVIMRDYTFDVEPAPEPKASPSGGFTIRFGSVG
jgi:curved DNA-binding protein CbpA